MAGATGQWITLAPYIRYNATRPNIWQDIGYDTWPLPGSPAVPHASAWYTWSHADSAAPTSRPAYRFASFISFNASSSSHSWQ